MTPTDTTSGPTLTYPVPPFVSAHQRARATIVLLWVGIVIHLIAVPIDVIAIVLPEVDPNQVTSDNLAGSLALLSQGVLGLVSAGVYIATAVIFLMWLYRACSNLPAFGAQKRFIGYSPGWAVGYFFLPFANLFMPYQAIKELWQKSQPPSEEALFSSSLSPPGVFPLWWGFWLACNFAGNIYFRLSTASASRQVIFSLGAAVDVFTIIAAWLATMVIKEIDERQTHAAGDVPAAPVPPPPPVFGASDMITRPKPAFSTGESVET